MRTRWIANLVFFAAVLTGCAAPETAPTAGGPNARTADRPNQTAPQPGPAGAGAASEVPPWCVTGRITDRDGQPLAGVEVRAHCGMGTLFQTGAAPTGADGKYRLQFGPGIQFQGDHSGLQAATISPHKSGWIETNLHRQGDLLMAARPPAEDEQVWGSGRVIVYPNQPVRLDFVLAPAGAIRGRVVDAGGAPLAACTVELDAEALPPSSSVLEFLKTDEHGRFEFREVPPGPVWLNVRDPQNRGQYTATREIAVASGQAVEVEITYVAGQPGRADLRTP